MITLTHEQCDENVGVIEAGDVRGAAVVFCSKRCAVGWALNMPITDPTWDEIPCSGLVSIRPHGLGDTLKTFDVTR